MKLARRRYTAMSSRTSSLTKLVTCRIVRRTGNPESAASRDPAPLWPAREKKRKGGAPAKAKKKFLPARILDHVGPIPPLLLSALQSYLVLFFFSLTSCQALSPPLSIFYLQLVIHTFTMGFTDLVSDAGLTMANNFLSTRSYIVG